MRALAGAVLALLTACHSPSLVEVTNASAARWQAATCIPGPMPRVIVRLGRKNQLCGFPQRPSWGCHWPGVIEVAGDAPASYWPHITLHEYGHELDWTGGVGPFHVPAGHGVMGTNIAGSVQKISSEDIDLVCRNRPCFCKRPEK